MNIIKLVQEKWINRTKQYGLNAALVQVLKALIRPLWQLNRDVVFAIPQHQHSQKPLYDDIMFMTEEMVKTAILRGELTNIEKMRFLKFLNEGCRGFMAFVDNNLAGYGFIQSAGIYSFGANGKFQIPRGMTVFKNLFILTKYRGSSLGKRINQARLAAIPEIDLPLGFVIFENRYAMRNWKMLGAEEMLVVTRTTWFKKWPIQKIKIIKDCEITRRIMEGLNN